KMIDFCTYLVEGSQYEIIDVWNVVGLRGTGSNDIVVKDALIPAHRVLSFADMAKGTSPGLDKNTNSIYRLPWGTIHPTTITSPLMGLADGCYEVHRVHPRNRVQASTGATVKDDPFAKVRLAEAASEIDAGWLQLMRNLRVEKDAVDSGDGVTMEMRTRARRDQVRATQRSIDAIGLLFQNSGARALDNTSPSERFSLAEVRLAGAASEIAAGWLQLMRNRRVEKDAVDSGDGVTMEMRTRARRDQVRATQRSIDAIGLLFQNSGARALDNTSPIQRFWRDANAGRVHAANDAVKIGRAACRAGVG